MAAVGRIGEPEDIAHLVSYLASKEASFITGEFPWLLGEAAILTFIIKRPNCMPSCAHSSPGTDLPP
jgi:hypothetical protein